MGTVTRLVGLGLVSAVSTLGPVGSLGVAHASGGSGVVQRGTCTDGSEWKLKAKNDDGRIEVEWEVDSNQVGQTWSVRLRDNGTKFFAGHRTTKAPSGSFTVRDVVAGHAGDDTIRARSVHGEAVCRGSVSL